MRLTTAASWLVLCALLASGPAALAAGEPPLAPASLLEGNLVPEIRAWVASPVVLMTLRAQNARHDGMPQAEIDRLDKQWRAETKIKDQPLITAVLSNPLSGYLTRIQARALGLYSEIFVMDKLGLNAGQSSITTDYWQGDEAKWQKTYAVGPQAVFVDKAEYDEETATWRAQVNLTVVDEGRPLGAVTVEVNLTELARRRAANIR